MTVLRFVARVSDRRASDPPATARTRTPLLFFARATQHEAILLGLAYRGRGRGRLHAPDDARLVVELLEASAVGALARHEARAVGARPERLQREVAHEAVVVAMAQHARKPPAPRAARRPPRPARRPREQLEQVRHARGLTRLGEARPASRALGSTGRRRSHRGLA